MKIEFLVHGTPQPQGSAKAFIPRGWNRAIITSDNAKLKPWRQEVSGTATVAMQQAGQEMTLGAVSLSVEFYFAKPKSVKGAHKITRPDADKLLRSVNDALTGIVFKDDSQVVHTTLWKRFGLPEGARIIVESL